MNISKKNNLIILLAILGIAGFSILYATAGIFKTNRRMVNDLTGGLVAYWTLDGQDINWGTNKVTDKSGNSNTGAMTNMSTSTSPKIGVVGQALNFDGVDDSFVATDSDSLDNTNKLTISFWVYQTSFAGWNGFIGKSVGTDNQESYSIYVDPSGNLYVRIDGSGDTIPVRPGDYFMSLNTWEHIVVVYDGTLAQAQRVKVYIGGTLQGTYSETSSSIPNYASNLTLGNLLEGAMDEVRIYNRDLSATEVKELYDQKTKRIAKTNASPVSSLTGGLVGYWTLDGQDTNWTSASAGTTNNRGSLGGTGTLTNMSRSTSPAIGKIGQAMSFDGSNDSILTSDSASLSVAGAMSASFWMNASDVSTDQSIIDKYDAVGGQRSYRVAIKGVQCNAGEIIFTLSLLGSPFSGAVYCSNEVISTNQWYHIVATYIPSSSMKIYVNGTDQTRALVFGSGIPASIFDSTRDLAIGAGFNNSATPNATFFSGLIDETRIYNRALSASEVMDLYNMGVKKLIKTNMPQTDRWSSGLVGYWTMNGQDTNWSSATAGSITDKSPAGTNTGVLTNMSRSTSPTVGKIGQAMSLDGVNDYAIISSTNFSTLTAGNLTVSTWFKTTATSGSIFAQQDGTGLGRNIIFISSNVVCSYLNGDSVGALCSTGTVNDGSWHHVSYTYDGTFRVFVDGILQNSRVQTINEGATGSFIIGAHKALTSSWFNGSLDEVRIYNRALSTSEVLEMYQSGAGK